MTLKIKFKTCEQAYEMENYLRKYQVQAFSSTVNPTGECILQKIWKGCEENKFCLDCNASYPKWTNLLLSTIICEDCAGAHRNFNAEFKIKSLELDEECWKDPKRIEKLMQGNCNFLEIEKSNGFCTKPYEEKFDGCRNEFITSRYQSYIANPTAMEDEEDQTLH